MAKAKEEVKSILDLMEDMKDAVDSSMDDAVKFFEKGNNSAGTRLRKDMQVIKAMANEIRIKVQEAKHG